MIVILGLSRFFGIKDAVENVIDGMSNSLFNK